MLSSAQIGVSTRPYRTSHIRMYSATTSSAFPDMTGTPASRYISSSQNSASCPTLCDVTTIVLFCLILSWVSIVLHWREKISSPTNITSSISRMSNSVCTVVANPSRNSIPLEYVLIGCSIRFPEPGEAHDLVEPLVDLGLGKTQQRALVVDVGAPGELGVEAGNQVEHRRDPPARNDPALGRRDDARRRPSAACSSPSRSGRSIPSPGRRGSENVTSLSAHFTSWKRATLAGQDLQQPLGRRRVDPEVLGHLLQLDRREVPGPPARPDAFSSGMCDGSCITGSP